MKIINETELMANQKASTVIVPDKQFEALQTIEGNSLLFSIGADNILYCTREVPGDTHGWVRVDLSSSLSAACYGGATVIAKTFDIAQDLTVNNTVDVALVVTVKGKDYLHLATGFTNTLDNWASDTPVFTQYAFDDYAHMAYAGLPINEVQILDGNGNQYIIADVVTGTNAKTISRYYIDTGFNSDYPLYVSPTTQKGCAWVPHNLSVDLEAGQVTSFLGCGPSDGPDSSYGAGDGAGNNIGGVYVLGTINNEAQLMYAPTFNFETPVMQQNPTIFNIPSGTDASYMAMALSAPAAMAPYTDLFFASNGSLYFLACKDQVDTDTANATPQLIYTHDLFKNIQSLHIENWNDNIVLWGQSIDPADMQTSRLFIMEGVAGQETNADAWSCPVPLLFNVVNSATYVNVNYSLDSSIDSVNGNAYGSCSVLFAQQVITEDDGTLVPTLTQLFQDPVTTAWQQRSLLTAPAAENIITEMYETTTYSSHIEITDDSNVPAPLLPVCVWASSPCSVYVTDANNTAAYLTLDTQKPLHLTSGPAGHITIMQPADTIGGISYYVAVQDPSTKNTYTQVINPLAATISNLNAKVPDASGDHLSGVQVTDEWGNTTPLVSSNYASQTIPTSNSINTICQQNVHLNQDGLTPDQTWPDAAAVAAAFSSIQSIALFSVKATATPAIKPLTHGRIKHSVPLAAVKNRVKKFARPDRQFKNFRFNSKTSKIWGWTFGENAKHYEGMEAVKAMGVVLNADGSLSLKPVNAELGSIFGHIEAKIGHIVKWMQTEAHKLEQAVITFENDVVDCLLTIAGDVYHFVAKCANDIVNLVHTVMNAIKTAFADLVKWIGSIFAWMDILRTHSVFRSLFQNYMSYCIKNIGSLQTTIDNLFLQVENDINTWAGLPTDSYSSQQATNPGGNGQKHPSSHWVNHHLSNNASNAVVADDAEEAVLDDLENAVDNEYVTITNAVAELQTVFNNASSMPVADVVKEVVGIMANTVLKSANNIIDATIEVSEAMLDGVDELITAPLHIPVLSNLYSTFTHGSQLSYLDLACLAAAIPATVIYKIANDGDAPFPKGDATSDALINAASLEAIADLCYPSTPPSAAATGGLQYSPNDLQGSVYDKINFFCNIAASFGGLAVSILGFAKTKLSQAPEPPQKVISVMSKLYAGCYVPYIAPDVGGAIQYIKTVTPGWYNDLSALLGIGGFAKTLADLKWSTAAAQPEGQTLPKIGPFSIPFGKFEDGTKVNKGWYEISPLIETVINLVWEVPVVFQYINSEKKTNDILALTANTCFNTSGVLTPFVSYTNGTPQLIFAGISAVLNIGYGVLSAFWALDNYSNK